MEGFHVPRPLCSQQKQCLIQPCAPVPCTSQQNTELLARKRLLLFFKVITYQCISLALRFMQLQLVSCPFPSWLVLLVPKEAPDEGCGWKATTEQEAQRHLWLLERHVGFGAILRKLLSMCCWFGRGKTQDAQQQISR